MDKLILGDVGKHRVNNDSFYTSNVMGDVLTAGAMTRYSYALFQVVFLLSALFFCAQAEAHNRSQSFSSWDINGDSLDVVFTVKAREVTRLPPLEGGLKTLDALLTAHLQRSIKVESGDQFCQSNGEPVSLPAATGYVRAKWSFSCVDQGDRTLHMDSFFSVASSHVHYAQVAFAEEVPEQYLFTDDQRSQVVNRFSSRIETFHHAFLQYAELGINHIFSGLDHIAFLLALMLLLRRLRDVVWMVSGFTLGHSITLSLAVLGLVEPDILLVEALIGFTIALVAVENLGAITRANRQLSYAVVAALSGLGLMSYLWGGSLTPLAIFGLIVFTLAYLPLSKNRSEAVAMRPFLTLVFGLIHGFGFAGLLSEIGLPEQRYLSALAGFNVGVELGQLIIVGAAWYLVSCARRFELIKNFRAIVDGASAILLAVGSYWFVVRSFAL